MIEFHTKSGSRYLWCGYYKPLIKVGVHIPVMDCVLPDEDRFGIPVPGETDRLRRGAPFVARGIKGHDMVGITTSLVTFETNYRDWCCHQKQPQYILCTDHLSAWAENGNLRKFGATTWWHSRGCDECDGTFVPFTW